MKNQIQRAVIIAKGEVQGVGYRGIVRKIARKLNIVGRVRNIKPYDVEITAEGKEKDVKRFIEQIKVKEFPVDIEGVNVRYEKPTGEFDIFEIERGDLEEELGERLDIAREVMDRMVGKQDQTIKLQKQTVEKLGSFQKETIKKQDQTIKLQKQTVEKLDSFHQDTVGRFDTLREDYGRISRDIATAVQGIEKVSNNIEKLIEKSDSDRRNFEKSMDRIANAILKLAEKKT
jgi:acylphosphatase